MEGEGADDQPTIEELASSISEYKDELRKVIPSSSFDFLH